MTTITAKQACAAYMKKQATCPFCNGDIVADEMTGESDCQLQETHCYTCRAAFTETYQLVHITVENGPRDINIPGIKEYVK